jgi:hypothetical protein
MVEKAWTFRKRSKGRLGWVPRLVAKNVRQGKGDSDFF